MDLHEENVEAPGAGIFPGGLVSLAIEAMILCIIYRPFIRLIIPCSPSNRWANSMFMLQLRKLRLEMCITMLTWHWDEGLGRKVAGAVLGVGGQ